MEYSKVGTSKCQSFLGLVAVGDCSIEEAARTAGITSIHHVDYETLSVLGIYAEFVTTVYGE